jgi:hypothetical protein
MSEVEQENQPPQVALPIQWHVSDNLPSIYANNVVVQQGVYEFIISFFEAKLPLTVGTPEEIRARLTQLEGVPAECVARVLVAPELVQQIINALQTTLDTYHAAQKKRNELEGGHTNVS